jgi:hypothetical protein
MGYKSTAGLTFGLSTKQQTSYSTALSTCMHSHPVSGNNTVDFSTKKFSNEEEYGTGHHGHASDVVTMSASTKLSLTYRMSSYIAGWVMGLAMGSVVTSQPDSTGSPLVYQHVFSISRNPQLPVTTIWEQLDDGEQYKYRDMLCTGYTLSGKTDEHLTIQANFTGSGHFETSSVVIPDPILTDFLLFHNVSMLYAGTEIAGDVEDLNIEYNTTVNESGGYTAGCPSLTTAEGKEIGCRSKLLKSKESVKLKFKLLYKDRGLFNDSLDNTEREILLSATGSPIDATYNHGMVISVPKAVLKTAVIGKSNDFYIYDVEVTCKWDSTIGPFQITLTNDVPEYLGTEI